MKARMFLAAVLLMMAAMAKAQPAQLDLDAKYVTTCQRNTRWDADALRQTVRQFADRLMAISRTTAE